MPDRSFRGIRWVGVAGLVAVLASSCTAAENAATGTKNLVNEAADVTTDATITFAVKTALADDEIVNSDDISVSTDHGVVTLVGTQRTDQARREAGSVAKQAKGVRGVVNKITVVPVSIAWETDPVVLSLSELPPAAVY